MLEYTLELRNLHGLVVFWLDIAPDQGRFVEFEGKVGEKGFIKTIKTSQPAKIRLVKGSCDYTFNPRTEENTMQVTKLVADGVEETIQGLHIFPVGMKVVVNGDDYEVVDVEFMYADLLATVVVYLGDVSCKPAARYQPAYMESLIH